MSSCNNEICLLDGIIHDDKEKEKLKENILVQWRQKVGI